MSYEKKSRGRSDHRGAVDRRAFMASVAGASALATLTGRPLQAGLFAAPGPTSAAETAVTEFYRGLNESQRQAICLPLEHELRGKVNANWHVTKHTLGDGSFSRSQVDLVRRILRGATSEDGFARLEKQMDFDSGGIGEYSVAVFGEPGGPGKFEFEITGRHLTLRVDGNTIEHAAFGGPIVYGHGEEDAKQNLFYYQTLQANEVFSSLSAEQSAKALLTGAAPTENAVQLQGTAGQFPGISVATLSADQQALVSRTLEVLLAPYRREDIEEVMQIVQKSGGIQTLNMAFYQQDNLDNDRLWDIWRIEGPSFVWHFRGAPHVHAYINIGVVST